MPTSLEKGDGVRRLCTAVLGLLVGSCGAWGADAPAGRRAKVFGLVHQIRTATDVVAPKATYGSGFVVGKDGLLATNFHVVSAALHEPKRYRLYIADGEQSLEARVVAIDVVNDLALVRVDRTFSDQIILAKEEPAVGAKIFSMGWPEDLNKSVIEGNFNGIVREGPYQKVQMSIPLNSGMSGGPTIDRDGELLGVNVSIQLESQSLAFAVPAAVLADLMARPEVVMNDAATFHAEVRRQLLSLQDQLSNEILDGPRETVRVMDWRADKPARLLKCWRESEAGIKDLSQSTTETCYLPNGANVRSDMDTGTFRLRFEGIESSKLNSWQFLELVNRKLHDAPILFASYVEGFTTKFKCEERDIVNLRGVPLRVNTCVNAFVRYPDLYNLEAEAVTLTAPGSAIVVSASYSGFTEAHATTLLQGLLDSIRRESP